MVQLYTIQIGYTQFAVKQMTPDEVEEVGHGVCNYSTCTIKIDTTQNMQCQIETLWHEVKHAIHNIADLGDESKEEEFVTRSAPLEIDTLRRNPGLMDLISGADTEVVIGPHN